MARVWLAVTSCLLLVCIAASSAAPAQSSSRLQVVVDQGDGSYKVLLGGKLWFNSGPVSVRNQGRWYTTADHSLRLGASSSVTGENALGEYSSTVLSWLAEDGFGIVTSIDQYVDFPAVEFHQFFVDGITDPALDQLNATLTKFPSFVLEKLDLQRGYLTYSGPFAKGIHVGEWPPQSSTEFPPGPDGGMPLVVFDSELENTVVVSPSKNFMAASHSIWQPSGMSQSDAMGFGLIGSIDGVPKSSYVQHSTILVAGQNVTDAMEIWGGILRLLYRKDPSTLKGDYTYQYLGYWTDNGACYYYNTGNYSNYEEAMVAVWEDASKMGIPFRYLQIDSWWYYKGKGNGVKNWTAMPDIFPNGIDAVVKKTGWPIMAHNRYFSSDTDYAKQNGGAFEFYIERETANPNDASFWEFLLSSSKREWGLLVYEQDWLYHTYNAISELRSDFSYGRDWLMQMGTAASELGISIQYCMPYTRHILQSVEIPAVTQVRASDDYQPGNYQWMIGETSLLAHVVGLAPFKDTFVTSSSQTLCKFGSEPYPALETYVAALSSGPMGPSDTVGHANRTLVLATCMSDGRLLKPSRPAFPLDSSYLFRAFGEGGPDGTLTATFAEVTLATWYYTLAADLLEDYKLYPSDLPPSRTVFPKTSFPDSIAFTHSLTGPSGQGTVTGMQKFSADDPLTIKACGRSDFKYWSIAPILPGTDMAVLGELNKIVTVSETRFFKAARLDDDGSYEMSVMGEPGEKVFVSVYSTSGSGSLTTVKCDIPSTGTATLLLPQLECSMYG